MDFITLLTVIAFLLIAVNISSMDKNPWVMLCGIGLLGIATAPIRASRREICMIGYSQAMARWESACDML